MPSAVIISWNRVQAGEYVGVAGEVEFKIAEEMRDWDGEVWVSYLVRGALRYGYSNETGPHELYRRRTLRESKECVENFYMRNTPGIVALVAASRGGLMASLQQAVGETMFAKLVTACQEHSWINYQTVAVGSVGVLAATMVFRLSSNRCHMGHSCYSHSSPSRSGPAAYEKFKLWARENLVELLAAAQANPGLSQMGIRCAEFLDTYAPIPPEVTSRSMAARDRYWQERLSRVRARAEAAASSTPSGLTEATEIKPRVLPC